MIRRQSILWIALILLAAIGVSRLRFDAEVLQLLPDQLPAVQGLKIYQKHFTDARELVVTIKAPDPEQAENTARLLADHLRSRTPLVEQVIWQPPWLEHPGQAAELIGYLWLNQPPELFAALTNRFEPGKIAQSLRQARAQLATSMSPGDIARLGYDPLGLTRLPESAAGAAPAFGDGQELFASEDGTFRILFVYAAGTLRTYRDNIQWFESVKQLVQDAVTENGVEDTIEISYTGGPAFVSEISSGMENDLRVSVGTATLVIVVLFWIIHRRLKPLLWLLTLLGMVLLGTLAAAGLAFGTVNAVSIGFAAILLGLSADYGLVLYQEALHAPETSLAAVRRRLAPGIAWSALTTAGAFLILNLGDLPGLAQLGSLVAIGITIAAIVMLFLFLGPLEKGMTRTPLPVSKARVADTRTSQRIGWSLTAAIVLLAGAIALKRPPGVDHGTDSLRPRNSAAYSAMEQIKTHLSRAHEPEWLLIAAPSRQELADKLRGIETTLNRAMADGEIERFTLPTSLAPVPDFQRRNREAARFLGQQFESVTAIARDNGFTPASLAFTEAVLAFWRKAASGDAPITPDNPLGRWVMNKALAQDSARYYALGLIYPDRNSQVVPAGAKQHWTAQMPREGVWLAGWERLGSDLVQLVERDLWRVFVPIVILLIACLFLAFKRVSEVLLSVAALLFSGLCLWAIMGLAGWSWNLLNMLAIPLMLGAGVDYGIHMQLALRRHGGNIRESRATIGRALMLCAGTTVAGFGSNAWSSNLGLASLGVVCATGVAIAFLTSCCLLPVWWKTFSNQPDPDATAHAGAGSQDAPAALSAPSSLYRSEFWRAGLWIVRVIPRPLCLAAGRFIAALYWVLAPARREILVRNLMPALNNDSHAARTHARRLVRQFATKIVDLWRYEAGLPVENLLGEASGWEHFAEAQRSGRGVLLLTPHLGNWEFGGPWLTRRGITLQVITLAEPGRRFTELRQASRARWNIETIVIGNDPFAFLEIIRRLESGATVALLVDRPPAPTAVQVELFGRPFQASIAAAELARASGCILLPVFIPHTRKGYAAHILPPIPYERASLRDRDTRQKLTQHIMKTFEPAIREYIDQWYHFISIWPKP